MDIMQEIDIIEPLREVIASYQTFLLRLIGHLKKNKIVNLTSFVLLSFFELRNIRRTCSKYFQNNFYKTDISSVAQRSTT